ncbi:MAG: FprA family A-type flavoprotein [Desulfurococcales archaeon]|nr:FprA family A-type flavoprotein [Desulfurococcales archaeon]
MATYRIEEITDDLFLLRVGDRITRYFEALWEIPEGVTYNAYLLKTSEGSVLIDGWKSTFATQLIDALEYLVEPDELRYVVVNHMEPDHTGSLEEVLRWAPSAIVLAHPMTKRMMDSYPRAFERLRPVKDGETIEIGDEKLVFIHTPWLHWPETMMTWLENRRVLLSCDAFGGFGIPEGVFDDECAKEGDFLRSVRKYVVTVIGNYRSWIVKALDKLEAKGIDPEIIAPGHGLLWRGSPKKIIEYYRSLAEARPVKGKILVLYASMYGTVESMTRMLACELRKKGLKPIVYGFTDTFRPNISDILADAIDAEALVVSAPTYEAGLFPLMKYTIEEICEKAAASKRLIVLATYGWGGIAAKRIRGQLESCGFETIAVLEERALSPAGGILLQERIRELVDEILKIS